MKGWDSQKLKYVTDSIFRGDAPTYVEDVGIRVVNQACVQDSGLDLSRAKYHDLSDTERLKGWLKAGDVLVNSTGTGTLGRVALFGGEYEGAIIADGHITIVRSSRVRIEPRFLAYALSIKQDDITVYCSEGATNQIELSRSKLGSLELLLPSLEEQQAAADMLDRETARLDELIAEKKHLVELLAEKRRALIARAVTRGLNPDVPLRDSGFEWPGVVPEHWVILHLKRLLVSVDYGTSEAVEPEGNIIVLRMGDIRDGEISFRKVGFINEIEQNLLLQVEDLVFNRTNSLDQVGKVGIFRGHKGYPVTFASYLVRMRCSTRVVPDFLNYLLNSAPVLGWAKSEALPAIGQVNLNPYRYGFLPLALPPLDEQRTIVRHIKRETAKLDELRRATESTINLLSERRTALIAAAVTGQLAVHATR